MLVSIVLFVTGKSQASSKIKKQVDYWANQQSELQMSYFMDKSMFFFKKIIEIISSINFCWLASSITDLHLNEPGFTPSTCGAFTKHGQGNQNFRETDYLTCIRTN